MQIIVHNKMNFKCPSSTSADDGRALVNGWRQLLETYKAQIGHKLIVVLHYGSRRPFLFLTSMLQGVLEYYSGNVGLNLVLNTFYG